MEEDCFSAAALVPVSRQGMQLLECPVCLDGFNETSHTPRLLCCGHTVCQLCVERLVLSSRLPLRCPECRALCKWRGIQELPKNYILLHALGSTSYANGAHWTRKLYLNVWQHAPVISSTGTILRLLTPRMLEDKLWQLGKVVGASIVLLVFVPLSIMHLCLSWWTALLGFVIFSCFSIGAMGIALFLLFLWWTQNVVLVLHRFAKWLFKVRLRALKF